MNRRNAFKQLLKVGAIALTHGILSCTTRRAPTPAQLGRQIRVDDSFARLALRAIEDASLELKSKMLAHPALIALLRHQHLTSNRDRTLEILLDNILQSIRQSRPTSNVLDAWKSRENELGTFVEAAAQYLPKRITFGGTVYFVIGYDIGVAAPPDLALNVGHEHFLKNPLELGFYATHEAHHVGFMTLRQLPVLQELNKPKRLKEIIQYMTQLEGMGVHAAFNLRAKHAALGADADYRIYTDPAEGLRVAVRYAELISKLSGTDAISDNDVGIILNAMSSGERIWYRFGALISWTLERSQGRDALIRSITNPESFWAVAEDLLQAKDIQQNY